MLVTVENISKIFLGLPVLQNVSLVIEDHDRIGLIGINGAGKSTLLRLICGLDSPDKGNVYRANGKAIGFLQQNSGLNSDNTIDQEMKLLFSDLLKIKDTLTSMEIEISNLPTDSENYKKLARRYSQKQTHFEQQDGYLIDVKINTILNGMGFENKPRDTMINTLSGGEKTRLAMAKLLLQQPDLLILDEPTNHLDFKTLYWLERYLTDYKGALLTVSHDRYFLDHLVNNIWEVENKTVLRFNGNYTKFTSLKHAYVERQVKEYTQQQKQIASMQDYIDRNKARASTAKSARGRQNALDRMEIIERPAFFSPSPQIRFDYDCEPVKDVLDVRNLSLELGGNTLLKNIDLHVFRREKIALIGGNGMGKTSLLKAIQGLIPVNSGNIKWGKNVSVGYYRQELENLNHENTVLEELWSRFPSIPEEKIRNALGGVLLTGENVYKKVGIISGGEKARLSLAAIMLEKPNLLIMDEPTNHLDLYTKEILEQALMDFTGTVFMVSHDRYLLNKIPDKIIELINGAIFCYKGGFDNYQELQQQSQAKHESSIVKKITGSKKSKEQKAAEASARARIRELEQLICQTEQDIEQLETQIIEPEIYQDYKKMRDTCKNLELKKQLYTEYFEVWAEISESL